MGIAWHPTDNRIATASDDGTARIWHPNGTLIATLALAASGALDWRGDWLALAAGRHWCAVNVTRLLGDDLLVDLSEQTEGARVR